MAKIPLSKNTYSTIPEGDYVFECVKANYDENFGKVELELECSAGVQKERFNLLGNDGELNDGAYKAFSYTAKCLLNDFNAEEVDVDDLLGCKMVATVVHNIVKHRDTGKDMTFVNLTNNKPFEKPKHNPLLDMLNG